MGQAARQTLRARERLAKAAAFRRVFRRGLRLDGPLFLLLAAENDRGLNRLGLAASRRLGPATVRNRAKRLLREAFRRNAFDVGRALDVVLVPKPDIASRTLTEVEREYRERLRRLARRRTPGAHRPGAAAPD